MLFFHVRVLQMRGDSFRVRCVLHTDEVVEMLRVLPPADHSGRPADIQ